MVDNDLPKLQLECQGIAHLDVVARQIISFGEDYHFWAFEGDMGAGKTTLIKAICDVWNVEDNVSSPTFSIVNEYANDKGETFYHFDFYRIKDESEAQDIGAEEYFYSGNYCFVEWPSKIEGLIPDKWLKVEISIKNSVTRLIELTRYDQT